MVAVVVDEFGAVEGTVTIEDEHDVADGARQWVRKVATDEHLVSARVEVETLREQLKLKLPQGRYATLAGFVLAKAGEVPFPGTKFDVGEWRLTVVRSAPQAIHEVRLKRLPASA
jgi:CBS domain containing-hemolysin-like protein